MTNHEAQTRPRRFTDQRGIALQTVIIMVVLLAIAGGVAAVLFSRANDATQSLEQSNVSAIDYRDIGTESLCEGVGGVWDTSGDPDCQATTAVKNAAGSKADCDRVGGAWTAANNPACA